MEPITICRVQLLKCGLSDIWVEWYHFLWVHLIPDIHLIANLILMEGLQKLPDFMGVELSWDFWWVVSNEKDLPL